MKDHPIPQDVTGYKFHIVGNMTLKQFGLIVFGVIVAFIIYQLKLPALIAYPFIILFAGGGLLAAFVPFEERPLDHWIFTFIKTLYRPTLYYWQRKPHIPEVFNYVANSAQNIPPPADLAPAKRARIHDYLNSLHTGTETETDDEHAVQMTQIMSHFSSSALPIADISAPAHQPSMTVRVRALAPDPEKKTTIVDFSTPAPTSDISSVSSPIAQTSSVPTPVDTPAQMKVPVPTAFDQTTIEPTLFTPPISTPPIFEPTPTRTITQAAGSVQVPTQTSVVIEHHRDKESDHISDSTQIDSVGSVANRLAPLPTMPSSVMTQNTISTVTQSLSGTAAESAQQPSDLPFPSSPTEPNVVVGMVVNKNQELLPGTIVEVATASGQVVRVVRTNALGQFFVTTPLPNGSYVLQAEQEGLQFTPQQLEITNSPVAPLLFRATG